MSTHPQLAKIDERIILRLQASDAAQRGIYELIAGKELRSSLRVKLMVSYFEIALEHLEAMCVLVQESLTGSAFALLRSHHETIARGLWVGYCATDSDLQKVVKDDDSVFGSFREMVAAIDSKLDTDGLFEQHRSKNWKGLNSFTHSGILQIQRRFTAGEVKPSYSVKEVVKMIDAAGYTSIFYATHFLVLVGLNDEAMSAVELMKIFAAGKHEV